jgi:tRNA pseudouridine55 synthase
MLTESDKRYTAVFTLGKTTDTLDAEGEITSESEVTCTEEEIRAAVSSFEGECEQIPPMYSAIKRNGKKLYELAREGIEVEREARRITIYSIAVLSIDGNDVTIDVRCSKGTYIRTLCDDIGARLGCGAYMTSLVRTQSGMFTIDNSFKPEELDGDIKDRLIPTDKLFSHMCEVRVNDFLAAKVKNGVPIRRNNLNEGEKYRVYDEHGNFLCVSVYTDGALKMEKAFWDR